MHNLLSPRFRSISFVSLKKSHLFSFLMCLCCITSRTQNVQGPKISFKIYGRKKGKKLIELKFCNRCDTEHTTDTCIDFSLIFLIEFSSRSHIKLFSWRYVVTENIMWRYARYMQQKWWECLGCLMSKNERLSWKLKRQDHHRCGLYFVTKFGHFWSSMTHDPKLVQAFQQMRKIKIPSKNISLHSIE